MKTSITHPGSNHGSQNAIGAPQRSNQNGLLGNADQVDGLSCHEGTCHIARSEFEIQTPPAATTTQFPGNSAL